MHGRIVAGLVFKELFKSGLIKEEFQNPFVSTVENACLLHDIGNPPFGHFGEFTIRGWFSEPATRSKLSSVPDPYYSDLTKFDGNAQGFRIISRLSWTENRYGLNLTCSLLLSYLKYGCNGFEKKQGFFKVDEDRVQAARTKLGMGRERFPLTFLRACA